jgi:hypothetical protein
MCFWDVLMSDVAVCIKVNLLIYSGYQFYVGCSGIRSVHSQTGTNDRKWANAPGLLLRFLFVVSFSVYFLSLSFVLGCCDRIAQHLAVP